jgi:hypothetical protein
MNPLSHLAPEEAGDPLLVYTAKKIITMERGNQEATAVAVSGKQIVVTGSLDEVKKFLGDSPHSFSNRLSAVLLLQDQSRSISRVSSFAVPMKMSPNKILRTELVGVSS